MARSMNKSEAKAWLHERGLTLRDLAISQLGFRETLFFRIYEDALNRNFVGARMGSTFATTPTRPSRAAHHGRGRVDAVA
jgi:hypothetical protein